MDDTDRELIGLLRDNARTPVVALAKKLRVAASRAYNGPSLNLVRRQQDARLGRSDTLNLPDGIEHAVERFERVSSQFRHNVPAAVGTVQRMNIGVPS